VFTGTTFERVEDPEAPNGDWVLQVNSSGFEGLGGVHSPALDVEPDQSHTVQMMVKLPVGRPFWMAISERNAENEEIFFDESPEIVGTGQWQMIERTRLFEDGVKLRAYFRMGGGNGEPGTFYLDAVPGWTPPPPTEPEEPEEPEEEDEEEEAEAPHGSPEPGAPTSGPGAAPLQLIDTPPTITAFGVTHERFTAAGRHGAHKSGRGTRFTFALSEPALVRITITRSGGRKGAATLSARLPAGIDAMSFSGRGHGGPLAPGSYRARIVATDAAGQPSRPLSTGFRILGG
jgi:hypothetical protein